MQRQNGGIDGIGVPIDGDEHRSARCRVPAAVPSPAAPSSPPCQRSAGISRTCEAGHGGDSFQGCPMTKPPRRAHGRGTAVESSSAPNRETSWTPRPTHSPRKRTVGRGKADVEPPAGKGLHEVNGGQGDRGAWREGPRPRPLVAKSVDGIARFGRRRGNRAEAK